MAEDSNETSSLSVDCSFSKLPDHLLIEILVLVPIVDWGQLSCVSKRWANLFREDNLWHAALVRCFPLAGQGKRWPGPIPRGVSKRRFAALCLSKCITPADDELSEIVGHTYLFLKEQLEIATNPPSSIILHGTMIDQFVIACGESRDRAAELASLIWLSVIENLEENHQTFLVLKRLSLEADVRQISIWGLFGIRKTLNDTPVNDSYAGEGIGNIVRTRVISVHICRLICILDKRGVVKSYGLEVLAVVYNVLKGVNTILNHGKVRVTLLTDLKHSTSASGFLAEINEDES